MCTGLIYKLSYFHGIEKLRSDLNISNIYFLNANNQILTLLKQGLLNYKKLEDAHMYVCTYAYLNMKIYTLSMTTEEVVLRTIPPNFKMRKF